LRAIAIAIASASCPRTTDSSAAFNSIESTNLDRRLGADVGAGATFVIGQD